jgi:hypothetical protein
MSLLILLVASYILPELTRIIAYICSYFSYAPGLSPHVPSLLAGYDNGLLYVLNPCDFLSRCQ